MLKDGSFGGVVVASMNPGHFTKFYDEITEGGSKSITLIGTDGIVRASGGGQSLDRLALGTQIDIEPALARLNGKAVGTFPEYGADRAQKRITTLRRVRNQDLAVLVSTSEDEILTGSRTDLFWTSLVSLVLSIIIAFVMQRSIKSQLQLKLAQTALCRSERKAKKKAANLEITLDNMDQGILMVKSNGTIAIMNRQVCQLLSLPIDFLVHKPSFLELLKFQELSGEFSETVTVESTMQQLFPPSGDRAPIPSYERTRSNGSVLEIRTVLLEDGGFVRTFSDISKRRKAQEIATKLALEDALTDLPNRRAFSNELRVAGRRLAKPEIENSTRTGYSILLLDLDQFKDVNDSLGHPTGDKLLQAVSARLKSTVRSGDVVARLGGDEFAILLPTITSASQPEALAKRLVQIVSQSYQIDGQCISIGVSIGIATSLHDGQNQDDLLKAADMALYSAKTSGRGRYAFYNRDMTEKVNARRTIEMELRTAITERQLELHYQPLIDLQKDRINGFEALVRWRHPVKGLIPPGDFISIAEQTGLIIPLGDWAIKQACADAVQWPDGIKVAVNLSPVQFKSDFLCETVRSAISMTGIASNRLELEITETTLMQDDAKTLQLLHELKGLGVGISMDDFGTGYSSLSYLRSFPFDKIKVDRSFIKDLGTASDESVIVKSILQIAAQFGMKVTAEGIETREQYEILKNLGCGEAQGYYFCRPVPISSVPHEIERWNASAVLAA